MSRCDLGNNVECQSESSGSSTHEVSADNKQMENYWFCRFDPDQTLDLTEGNSKNCCHKPYSPNNEQCHLSIQLRNERERNRVRAVNEAFTRLRKMIPYTAHRSKRVSKLKTLHKAVQYIVELKALLSDTS